MQVTGHDSAERVVVKFCDTAVVDAHDEVLVWANPASRTDGVWLVGPEYDVRVSGIWVLFELNIAFAF
jgi:NAD(P)H-dependent FMN reductase